MAGNKAIEHVTDMVVLGGDFQVGELYDYRIDRIVSGRPCWELDVMAQATFIDDKFKLELKCPDFGSSSHKWENMGLDEHLRASVMAGLIEKDRGAAKYLSDQAGFSKASQVLICRAESKKVSLDLQTLLNKELSPSAGLEEEVDSSSATHVVVGVTYGAEAYCVLGLELNGHRSDDAAKQDAREQAKEFLHKIARKMKEALDEYLDFSVFKDQLKQEETSELTRISCRLYADFQPSSFQECSVFEAYKHCRKLIDQAKKTDIRNKKLVPITIRLCPLQVITGQAGRVHCEYQDVDPKLVARCGRIWDELDRICVQSGYMRTNYRKHNRDSLLHFEKTIAIYKQHLGEELRKGIVKVRAGTGNEDEIVNVAKIAENHSIFKPSRLTRWLRYEYAEYGMSCKISGITQIQCWSNKRELEQYLKASSDKIYTVVLTIPSLEGQTKAILDAMKVFVDSYQKLVAVSDDEENSGEEGTDDDDNDANAPWHMLKRNRKRILAKIQELHDHVGKNKHIKIHTQFFIVFDQPAGKFGCRYSVYEKQCILAENLSQLPGCPTGLRIHAPKSRNVKKTSMYPIDVEWDYADLGLPCHFLVEYRLDGNKDEPWTQQRTSKPGETQLAIPYKTGSSMTIRVAADTCIGQSKFSEVIDTITILDLHHNEAGIPEKTQLGYEGSNDEIQQHVTKMVVLGNGFQVGQLYDYVNDRILKDSQKNWESSKLNSATHVDTTFVLEFKVPESGSDSLCNRMENMELDTHLQASIMAGLIQKPRGSSMYLSDHFGPSHATQVLICRAKSREVRLDLESLLSQDVPDLHDTEKEIRSFKSKTNPTYVVVGVTYGAEAYCVLTQDLKAAERVDDARGETEEYLSKIATKMKKALEDKQGLIEFKAELKGAFNDKENKQLSGTKCRLYTDLQTPALEECSVFDAYKHCLIFIQRMQKPDVGNNKPIPIATLLCPLKTITGQAEGEQCEYHDVDQDLINRCGQILDKLDRICAKALTIRTANKKTDKTLLSQFEVAIVKYKELMQKSLKNGTVKARQTGQQDEIEKVAKFAENNWTFKPTRLEQWLSCEQAECRMYDEIGNAKNIICLPSKKQLEMELSNFFDAEYTLVLSVSLFDKRLNGTLEAMKNYVAFNVDTIQDDTVDKAGDQIDVDSDVLWEVTKQKKNHVRAKIRELADHVEKNKHLENHVQVFITFGQPAVKCRYTIYKKEDILAENLSRLPGCPTGLRIHSSKCRIAKKTSVYAIVIEWDYADFGLPFHFLVEYRLDGNKDEFWKQQKTSKPDETQLAIPYKIGSPMTIRVAANTCIGRSPFSKEFNVDADWVPSEDDETRSYISIPSGGEIATTGQDKKKQKFYDWKKSLQSPTENVTTEPGSGQNVHVVPLTTSPDFNSTVEGSIIGRPNIGANDAGMAINYTSDVEYTRKWLEDVVQSQIRSGLAKMEQMRKIKQMVTNCQAQIDANQNVEFEVKVSKPKPKESGYLTNSNCHLTREQANDEDRVQRSAIDPSVPAETLNFTNCPTKCIWTMYVDQLCKWDYVKHKKTTSSDAVKQKYEKESKKKLTAEEIVGFLQRDIDVKVRHVLGHFNIITGYIQTLDATARRPIPFSASEFIDSIIDAEVQEKRQGYLERIESLKKLLNMSDFKNKIKTTESLMSLDQRDDTTMEEDDHESASAHGDDEEKRSRFQKFTSYLPTFKKFFFFAIIITFLFIYWL